MSPVLAWANVQRHASSGLWYLSDFLWMLWCHCTGSWVWFPSGGPNDVWPRYGSLSNRTHLSSHFISACFTCCTWRVKWQVTADGGSSVSSVISSTMTMYLHGELVDFICDVRATWASTYCWIPCNFIFNESRMYLSSIKWAENGSFLSLITGFLHPQVVSCVSRVPNMIGPWGE